MSEEEKEKETKISFNDILNDEVLKKELQKYVDKNVTKAIETFKNGSFQEAVEKAAQEKIEKSKEKSPEQLQLEEMRKTMEAMQAELEKERIEKIRTKNKNLALKGLNEKGLPTGLSDYVIADTEEETLEKLNNITGIFSEYAQNIKSEVLSNNNTYVPEESTKTPGPLKEPGENASKEEWKAYWEQVEQQNNQQIV